MVQLKGLLLLLLVLFAAPFAFAADDVEEVTEEEAEVLSERPGVTMRLAQLERQLYVAAEKASTALDWVEENAADVDTERLDEIIDELEALREELSDVDADTDDIEEIADLFLDYRAGAHDLVKEFREILRDALTDEQKEDLRAFIEETKEEYKENPPEEWIELTDAIKEARAELNAAFIERRFPEFAENNADFVNQVRSGELNAQEVKRQAVQRFKQLSPEQKQRVRAKFNEVKSEVRENIQEKRSDLKERLSEKRDTFKDRAQEVRDKHKDRIQNARDVKKQRVEDRKERVQDRVQDRKDRVQDRVTDRKDRVQDRVEDRKERVQDRVGDRRQPQVVDTVTETDIATSDEEVSSDEE